MSGAHPVDPTIAADEAAWVRRTCVGDVDTVGSLIPHGFDAVARVGAPDPMATDWVGAYRDLFAAVACAGLDHTDVPTRAWFAMEEGNEFGLIAPRRLGTRWIERTDLRDADLAVAPTGGFGDDGSVPQALGHLPILEMPTRSYRLSSGSVQSVIDLRGPASSRSWRHPDLYWPADRSWFVATDVDFWSLYVAGTERFVSTLAARVPTSIELVRYGDRLVAEE